MLFSVLTWTPFPVPAETLNKPISNVELAVGVAVLAAGFIFLNIASMAFKQNDLIGINNCVKYLKEGEVQHGKAQVMTPFPYNIVRHPMYTGMIFVHWA